MLGTKINKKNIDMDLYNKCNEWAKDNNSVIVDKGEYYECIAIQAYEPTKAESIAEIKKYYDERFNTLGQMVLRRRLINGDISDLQEQYKKLNLEMLAKIKAVK